MPEPDGLNSGTEVVDTRSADERVSQLWFKEGQHALLHHLSAVFGYRELLVVKPMRF